MEFLDKVKKVAVDVAAVSSKKSKKLYSIAKLNLEIAEKQNSVKSLYKEIGYDAYKAYKAEGNIVEEIKPKMEKVDALEDEIASLRKAIDDIKSVEEVGIEEVYADDAQAEEADVYDGQSEYDEAETEPIDSVE